MRAAVRSFVFVVSMLASSEAWADGPAPDPDLALRERLLVDYTRTHDVSTGCSLGEVERRLGRLAEARAHLEEALRSAETPEWQGTTETLSACRFNRARVLEGAGELGEAYREMQTALDTPNGERRRIIETRLVTLASRLARESGCAALGPRFASLALLRFGDDEELRRCATAERRTQPFCRRLEADELPSRDDFYAPRVLENGLMVVATDGDIYLLRRRGERVVGGRVCAGGAAEERVASAAIVRAGSRQLVEIATEAYVSYSCACEPVVEEEGESPDDDESPDCRCSDSGGARYVLTPDGELLLALAEAWTDRDSMASCIAGGEAMRDASSDATAVEGSVIVINHRRLTWRRGFLVPAASAGSPRR